MKSRFVKLCSVALALSLALGTIGTVAMGEAAKSDVTLVVAASQDWIKDIDRELAKEFEEQTGIKIDFQVNPDDQYTNIVKSKLATGEGPDIFYCNSGVGVQEYLPDKYFTVLSDEPWIANMEDWAIEAATYKGEVVGLDMWSIDGWGIVYNSDIFDRLGLSVPTNFEEFTAVCDAIQAAGITPIYEPAKDTWHGCLWLLEIADYVNKKYPGLYEKLNTPEGKFVDIPEALTLTEQYKQLQENGYFGEEYMSQIFDKGAEALATEQFAMFLSYTAWANENADSFPDANMREWGMFPVPLAGNDSFSHSGGGVLTVINSDSKHIEEAKEYFRFLTQPDIAQRYYDGKPKLATASVKGVTVTPLKLLEDMIANSPGGMGPDFAASIPFYNADNVGLAYQELLLGTKTPMETLEKVDADRLAMFEATAE